MSDELHIPQESIDALNTEWVGVYETEIVSAIAKPVVIAELDRLRRGMADPDAYSRLSARIEELES